MDNHDIFAENLNYYMEKYEKTRKEVSEAIGVSYFTFTAWATGKKYPRMDSVEKLAKYFGVLKSDLIEKKDENFRKTQQKNDTIADVVLRLRTDDEFFNVVDRLATDDVAFAFVDAALSLDDVKLNSLIVMTDALKK